LKITPELFIFAAMAGIAVMCAVGVVAFRSAVRSALCLVMNFFILGFIYFGLSVEMLGIMQIVVYTGAIMVLFLFVIMLLNLGAPQVLEEKADVKKPIGIALGVAMALLIASQVMPAFITMMPRKLGGEFGSPQAIGRTLFTDYVFPFEAVSVLLLIGLVGSILLAKRRIS
jgi:NADH-quinone oxidoreductase subunit J